VKVDDVEMQVALIVQTGVDMRFARSARPSKSLVESRGEKIVSSRLGRSARLRWESTRYFDDRKAPHVNPRPLWPGNQPQ
jgi:hypothetical protein